MKKKKATKKRISYNNTYFGTKSKILKSRWADENDSLIYKNNTKITIKRERNRIMKKSKTNIYFQIVIIEEEKN